MELEAEQRVSELAHDLDNAVEELERQQSDIGAIRATNRELENTIVSLKQQLLASGSSNERLQQVITGLAATF